MSLLFVRISIDPTGGADGTDIYSGRVDPFRLQQSNNFNTNNPTPGFDIPTSIDFSRAKARGYLRWRSILEKLSENQTIVELRNITVFDEVHSIGFPSDDYDLVTNSNNLLDAPVHISDSFEIMIVDENIQPVFVFTVTVSHVSGEVTPASLVEDINTALKSEEILNESFGFASLGFATLGINNQIIFKNNASIIIQDVLGTTAQAIGLAGSYFQNDIIPGRVEFTIAVENKNVLDDIYCIALEDEPNPGSMIVGENAIKRMVARALAATHVWNELVYDPTDSLSYLGVQPVGFVVENLVAGPENNDLLLDQEDKVQAIRIELKPNVPEVFEKTVLFGELSLPGVYVTTATAGTNATWEIISGNANNQFQINPHTGEITRTANGIIAGTILLGVRATNGEGVDVGIITIDVQPDTYTVNNFLEWNDVIALDDNDLSGNIISMRGNYYSSTQSFDFKDRNFSNATNLTIRSEGANLAIFLNITIDNTVGLVFEDVGFYGVDHRIITLKNASHDIKFLRCRIIGFYHDPMDDYTDGFFSTIVGIGSDNTPSSRDIVIEDCIISNVRTAIDLTPSDGIEIVGCQIYNFYESAIRLHGNGSNGTPTDTFIRWNVISQPIGLEDDDDMPIVAHIHLTGAPSNDWSNVVIEGNICYRGVARGISKGILLNGMGATYFYDQARLAGNAVIL